MNLMAEEGSFRNKVRREREPEGCRELLGDILSPSGEFSTVPFWFFNDRPEKEKIRRQALPGPLSAAAGRGLVKKSWEYLKKVLTNKGACGILIPADVRRCGGIGRHKGLKIPR